MLELIVLGVVQGLTEFLPVSSTAHLLFAEHYLGIRRPGLVLEGVLHIGTALAATLMFWPDVRRLIQSGLRLIMRRRTAAGSDLVAQENPSGRDIVAVTDLRLSNFVNNRPMTTDARDCLRLVETDRYRPQLSLAKSRVVLVRDDVEVAYDRQRVEQLFADGRQGTALPADPSGQDFIVGVENWPAFNRVYAELFGDARPARSVVPVGTLHHGCVVEIEAIAARGA